MDAHTKVFTLFLDTLTELVVSHKADLGDWLYILLTRLLNKLGADLLGSIIQKINRTLEVVRCVLLTLTLIEHTVMNVVNEKSYSCKERQ